jgi:uncharacterized protein (DUF169 family)
MLSVHAKELFGNLRLEYSPVAVKYSAVRPAEVSLTDTKLSLCQFISEAQKKNKVFCVDLEHEDCMGKNVLGMAPFPALGASGQAGYDFGVYKTQAANARLYQMIPSMLPGTINYITFAPVALCEFDPDLIIFVADTKCADILMRATSYRSGDLWESKTSPVISCAWMYVYPCVSGKVNYCVTGMHHGMGRRKVYPPGLHIISVPFEKLDEVILALDEMDWQLLAFRDDPESKAELKRRMMQWDEMGSQLHGELSLPENR